MADAVVHGAGAVALLACSVALLCMPRTRTWPLATYVVVCVGLGAGVFWMYQSAGKPAFAYLETGMFGLMAASAALTLLHRWSARGGERQEAGGGVTTPKPTLPAGAPDAAPDPARDSGSGSS